MLVVEKTYYCFLLLAFLVQITENAVKFKIIVRYIYFKTYIDRQGITIYNICKF